MKQFLLGVLTTCLVLAIGVLGYLKFGFAEVRGDLPPSKFETYLMRSAVHASVRREAPDISNPLQPSDEILIRGGKMYLNECSGCHGEPGHAHTFPDPLNPAAPHFPSIGTEFSEAQVFWVAKHGIRGTGMFANGVWDDDQKLWAVAAYIKRITTLPPSVKQTLEKPSLPQK
jgi:mono/diheme cytochrome c family protein